MSLYTLTRTLGRSEAPATPVTAGRATPGLAVDLTGVSKAFSGRAVLDRLDLAIPPSQFVALIGRSGCGKSTLLRLLAGLDTPTSGQLNLDGQPLAGLAPAVRMLFQDARLLPWQRVVDNVGIARGPDWRERAPKALAHVGLSDRATEWPAVLSGGQRQRVALARALVSRPRLLLLDEPFGALDALTRIEMQNLLADLWRRERFTVVLITHDVVEAAMLADRVLVLREGKIRMDVPVNAPRPRESDDPEVLRLEKALLKVV